MGSEERDASGTGAVLTGWPGMKCQILSASALMFALAACTGGGAASSDRVANDMSADSANSASPEMTPSAGNEAAAGQAAASDQASASGTLAPTGPTAASRSPTADAGAGDVPVVPEKFRGLFALDRKACAEDYSYSPAFQNVRIGAREVSFFETGGPVTDVNASGNAVAITLREQVGDGQFSHAIYLALNGDGTVRYKSAKEASKIYVKC